MKHPVSGSWSFPLLSIDILAAFWSIPCRHPLYPRLWRFSQVHSRLDKRNPLYLAPQSWQSLELG